METCCCAQVWVPGQRSHCPPVGEERARAGVQALLHPHPRPPCTDGVAGSSTMALSPILHDAGGGGFFLLFSGRKWRGTELGTSQRKTPAPELLLRGISAVLQEDGPCSPASAYTAYAHHSNTARMPHRSKKPTALCVPGISLPLIF